MVKVATLKVAFRLKAYSAIWGIVYPYPNCLSMTGSANMSPPVE